LIIGLYHATALLYLAAGVTAGLGIGMAKSQLTRASVWVLAVGAVVHTGTFSLLHAGEATPPLTDTASAVSFMAWIGILAFLVLLWRVRLTGLVVLVGPMAFLGVFFASMGVTPAGPPPPPIAEAGSVPHAHVLLASAGLGLLGLAGLAGVLFLAEHRRLKRKRPIAGRSILPSLEALDRVNAVALAVGFPLLTLGMITGFLWNHAILDVSAMGSIHGILTSLAWAVYAVLASLRFGVRQGARQTAASAVAGFVFLCLAVLGGEFIA